MRIVGSKVFQTTRPVQATLVGLLLCLACFPLALFTHAAEPQGGSQQDLQRVGGGLEALYEFNSSEGAVVKDRSGNDPALDLRIGDPKAVRLSDGGLEVIGKHSFAPKSQRLGSFKPSRSRARSPSKPGSTPRKPTRAARRGL